MVQDENEPHTHNRVHLSTNQYLASPAVASSSSSAHAVVVGPPSPSFVPFPPDKRLHTSPTWLPRPKQTQQRIVGRAPSTSTPLASSSSGMASTMTMSNATNAMSMMVRTESNTTATTTTCSDDTCDAAPLSRSSSSPSPSPSPSISPTLSKSPSRLIQSPTWIRTRTQSGLRTFPNIGPSSTTHNHTPTPIPTPLRPRPHSSRAAVESPIPATRQHVIDAFRLRQYELDLLNDLGCPSCGVPPGTLQVWRDGIGAKCSCCHTVFEGPKLRDCLQLVVERHTQFYDGVREDIRRCRAEVGVLGAKIDNLKAIIEQHRNAIKRPSARPSPSTLASELSTVSGDALGNNDNTANNTRSTGNSSSFVKVNTCNAAQHQHHPRET